MKKIFIYMFTAAAVFATGCSKQYDDTALLNRLDAVQAQIDKVKADLEVYNTEIAALSQLAQKYSAGSAVTVVEEIKEGDNTIGYKISFDDGTSINVMYGQNGADGHDGVDGEDGYIGTDARDGHSPVVGLVYQDGRYYWTVDGELLKDSDGNPVPASADSEAGVAKNGSTPQVSMENGKWYVTLDGVKTEVGSVADTEATLVVDGIFADENTVVTGEDTVSVTLADGTVMMFPMYQEYSITFSKPGEGDVLNYTLTGKFDSPKVTVMCSGGWDVVVDQTACTITLTSLVEEQRVDATFNVLVSDGKHSTNGQFCITEGNLIYE